MMKDFFRSGRYVSMVFCSLLAGVCAAPVGAWAADGAGGTTEQVVTKQSALSPAAQVVNGLGSQALALLANPSVTHAERQAQFEKMLNENFDVPRIGRFVMGRYWNQATPDQQRDYQTLFDRWIVVVYTDRLENYSGETFAVTGSHPDGPGTIVQSQIQQKDGPPVNVDWRVATSPGQSPRIVDVVVEGVSMLVSQREEFDSIIANNNGNIDALIKMLRDRVGQP